MNEIGDVVIRFGIYDEWIHKIEVKNERRRRWNEIIGI
jgi:hypothetical protein